MPAIAMIGITVLGLTNIVLGAAIKTAQGDLSLNPFRAQGLTTLVLIIVLCLVHGIYLYGAHLMLRGKDHKGAIFAMKMACVPILSPGVILGIPIAIWALVVLSKSNFEAQLDSADSSKTLTPPNVEKDWELQKIEKRIDILSRIVETKGTDETSLALLNSIDSTVLGYLKKTQSLLGRYIRLSGPEVLSLTEPLLVTLKDIETFVLENPATCDR